MKYLLALCLFVGCATAKPQPVAAGPDFMPTMGEHAEPAEAPSVKCPATGACVLTYVFEADVDDESVEAAIGWLTAAEKAGASRLVLEIDSGGGSVPAGFKLIKAMERLHTPVTCKIDGMAASMAFAILEGRGCTERVATKRSVLMAHSPAIGGMIRGGEEDFQNIAEMMRVLGRALAEQCAARMKVSIDDYLARTTGGKEWWLTPSEALKFGAVDRIE